MMIPSGMPSPHDDQFLSGSAHEADQSVDTVSDAISHSPDSSFGDGPGASAYLRAEQTLQDLASQLNKLGASEGDVQCVEGCSMGEKLALSAGEFMLANTR